MSFVISVAAAATVGGVELPPQMPVSGKRLELVSCGVRDTLWIDHYAAGLYVPPGGSTQAAADPKRPKAVKMKVINAQYLPERIPEKWRKALNSELAREPMVRVRKAYGNLRDGDEVTFTYVPKDGTTMTVNGKVVTDGLGHDIIDSILSAWAEGDPVSGKLHRLELEHPC